ncbi:hypothetical protein QCA50_016617 [Cerrena zonata]|uniref:Uncharacterized protein n=1 Tax=Cerrena zonata TaxID=2478898 RepID=A0AAW0FJL0_9APHY
MVPLRPRIDKVMLRDVYGRHQLGALGYVEVLFDALGYEFKHKCWVTRMDLPVEIQLGNDLASAFELTLMFAPGIGNVLLQSADAKKEATRYICDHVNIYLPDNPTSMLLLMFLDVNVIDQM